MIITEGYTDAVFIRALARPRAARSSWRAFMSSTREEPNGSSFKRSLPAPRLSSLSLRLLDYDDNGKRAQSQLEDFGWSKTREILSLGTWAGKCTHGHPVEIEDLIPQRVSEKIVGMLGEAEAVTAKRGCGVHGTTSSVTLGSSGLSRSCRKS